jgi:hypothetical protein
MDNASEGKGQGLLSLLPNASICFNFMHDGTRLKKSSWMVPHVVRHREGTDVVSWRCNWGHVCESECFYARSRDEARPIRQEQS